MNRVSPGEDEKQGVVLRKRGNMVSLVERIGKREVQRRRCNRVTGEEEEKGAVPWGLTNRGGEGTGPVRRKCRQ